MTDYDFGDVVLVPFPFTDQTTTKKRPAVVVSSSVYNRERPDIVLVAVTSQMRPSAFHKTHLRHYRERASFEETRATRQRRPQSPTRHPRKITRGITALFRVLQI
jgi:mRNA-degrading endonuclease toxin of MazEF toxin-antitoxin module